MVWKFGVYRLVSLFTVKTQVGIDHYRRLMMLRASCNRRIDMIYSTASMKPRGIPGRIYKTYNQVLNRTGGDSRAGTTCSQVRRAKGS